MAVRKAIRKRAQRYNKVFKATSSVYGILQQKMKRLNSTVHSLFKPQMPASVTGPGSQSFFALLYGVSAGLPPDGVRRGKGRSDLEYPLVIGIGSLVA
jgi:hypothetical protein